MVANTPNRLLHALLLDRNGSATAVNPDDIDKWRPEDGLLWLHLDVAENPPREWLQDAIGLESLVVEALTADETRPRSLTLGDGLLTVLRGVNMNPGDDPEDMVSIRMWIERDRIVSTRRRKLLSVQDLRELLEQGIGPRTSGEFLSELIGRLADRIGGFVDTIEDKLSSIEEAENDQPPQVRRRLLAVLRGVSSRRNGTRSTDFTGIRATCFPIPRPTACERKPIASHVTSKISIWPASARSCCRRN
jgi:zinc transporter